MFSFLKRKDSPAPAAAVDETASVQAARTRARRRLIGAAVLVGIGIIGFPLLFETQPRPIAVDIPIEIPPRERTPPLKLPPPKAAAVSPPRDAGPVLPEPVAEAPSAPAQEAAAAASAAAPRAETPRTEAPASAPAAAARVSPSSAESSREAQRAQALLDGKPVAVPAAASAPKAARYVVQAGAYTDAAALREARQKVEKLGLKTYTQVIETDSGARTRVRVGPFETREEAEKAAARIKGSGLAASILSL